MWLLLLVGPWFWTPAWSALSRDIFISGIVENIDHDTFILHDLTDRIWKLPKRVLKKEFELKLRPGQKITVQIVRNEFRPQTPRSSVQNEQKKTPRD